MPLIAGLGSQSTRIHCRARNGAALLNKVANDFSVGGTPARLWYYRQDSGKSTFELIDLDDVDNSPYTEGGIKHIGNDLYRVDLPDDATELGAISVEIGGDVDGGEIVSYPVSLIRNTIGQGGVYTVNFSVVDQDDNPIQGAIVIIKDGNNVIDKQPTSSLGIAVLSVPLGDFIVNISKGYLYSSTTFSYSITEDNQEPDPIVLTQIAASQPAALGLSTGFISCTGRNGLPTAGIKIFCRQIGIAGANGYSYSEEVIEFESALSPIGYAEYNGFIQNAIYKIWRGSLELEKEEDDMHAIIFTVPESISFELPKHLGAT